MAQSACSTRTPLYLVALSLLAYASPVQSAPLPEATMNVVWSASGESSSVGVTTLGMDTFVLLAGTDPKRTELRGVNSPNSVTPVAVEGDANGLSAGGGSLYASTDVDRSYFPQDFLSEAPHTDMSLAQFLPGGDILWQANLAQPGWQAALDVASLSDGAVVLGTDGDKNTILVWNVDAGGNTRWVSSFGTAPGDIAILPSGGVAVVGTNGSGTPGYYNEDVMLWLLNSDGTIATTVKVRSAINTADHNFFLRSSMAVTKDSIVVATEWPDRFSRLQPLQVASLRPDGTPRWTTPVGNVSCNGSLFAEASGDVLLACKEPELTDGIPYFDITRFDAATGEATSEKVAVPSCNDPKYWLKVEIASTEGNTARLVGMQPEPGNRSYCSWIGDVRLPTRD